MIMRSKFLQSRTPNFRLDFRVALCLSLIGGLASATLSDDQPSRVAEARLLLRQAEQLIESGSYAQARLVLVRVINLAPNWLRPHGCLAVAYQAENDRDLALVEYRTVQEGILTGASQQVQLLASYAAEVVWLINNERLTRHIPPLKLHPMLSFVANRHSEEMRDSGYFSHESPQVEHRTPADRFAEVFGFQPRRIAENIARRYGTGVFSLTLENIRLSHKDLMASPGHRNNILSLDYTDLGVGLAANRNGDFWLTELFVSFTR